MRHTYAHQQKILQKLALTPQMRQSIKLLGMSTKDLNEYVEHAVSANPFLKKEFGKKEARAHGKASSYRTSDRPDDELDYMANIPHKENPRSSLISGVRMFGLKDKALEIAEYLIYEMDDNGYITSDTQETAEALSADIGEVEKALEVIQNMEPPGIGARDVRECLQLQLKRANKGDSLEYTIVTEFTNELARGDIDKISKATHTGAEKVREAINNIKRLNPRPASSILGRDANYIIPDLMAEVRGKRINLILNREWLPYLGFYNPYEGQPDIAGDTEAKKFIKDNMESAKRLIDDLKRREDTIYKVAHYIINFQLSAITEDKHEIRTLTMQDLALALDLHKSTISRAVCNKYIQINNEVMPLASFLSKGVRKQNGEILSKAAIKKKIEKMVADEETAKSLSDDDIRKKLEAEGIVIKRRTVAKYRSSLRILPAYLRKNKAAI